MPVNSSIARSTALTVIMPPNPAFARLMNTATFPFGFLTESVGAPMTPARFKRHGKLLEIRVLGDTDESSY